MARLRKKVTVGEYQLDIQELTVGEVHQIWQHDVVLGETEQTFDLFDRAISAGAPNFTDIQRVCDITTEQLHSLTQSELIQLEEAVAGMNPRLFELRRQQHLLMAAAMISQVQSHSLSSEATPESSTTP